jgi:hypothetical protein
MKKQNLLTAGLVVLFSVIIWLCYAYGIVRAIKKDKPVVDKITVTYGEKFSQPELEELKTEIQNKLTGEIPISVTLTKYQLEKMLYILEEENGYGRPADPQDSFTFTSVARANSYSENYSVSSTHLAKKPILND